MGKFSAGITATIVVSVLLAGLVGTVAAQSLESTSSSPGILALTAEEITDEMLVQYVDSVFSKRLSINDTQSFFARLDEKQRARIADIIASDVVANKLDVDPVRWRTTVEGERKGATSCRDGCAGVPSAGSAVVKSQGTPIWNMQITNNQYCSTCWVASSWWQDQWCDSPNEPDIDWVFFFYPINYNADPANLHWGSGNAAFYLYCMTVYGGKIKAYAYNWDETHWCVGDGAVTAAGGPREVAISSFLTYIP